eukprot:g2161.t1
MPNDLSGRFGLARSVFNWYLLFLLLSTLSSNAEEKDGVRKPVRVYLRKLKSENTTIDGEGDGVYIRTTGAKGDVFMRSDGSTLYWDEATKLYGNWRLTNNYKSEEDAKQGRGYDFAAYKIATSDKYRSCDRENGWSDTWRIKFEYPAFHVKFKSMENNGDNFDDLSTRVMPPERVLVKLLSFGGNSLEEKHSGSKAAAAFNGIYKRDNDWINADVYRQVNGSAILYWIISGRRLNEGHWRLTKEISDAATQMLLDPLSNSYGSGAIYVAYRIPYADKFRSSARTNDWEQMWQLDFDWKT